MYVKNEEVAKRHCSTKAKDIIFRDLIVPKNTVNFWADPRIFDASGASPQGNTRGTLDYRPDFWGNIRGPRPWLVTFLIWVSLER